MIPDDVLLKVFDFYVDENMDGEIKQSIEKWITLAHVCRQWRTVVFQSPRRLNLRLFCTPKTPTRDTLDVWPPLPLVIHCLNNHEPFIEDDIIAALEHNDRVCQIELDHRNLGHFTNSAAILKPFPELTVLSLRNDNRNFEGPKPMLPDSFLGGSAPRLRSLSLKRLAFPGLPKLLLSTPHLVNLDLTIPRSGYVPPEVMATSLSALTCLDSLCLELCFVYSPPHRHGAITGHPPPLTRTILPSLTKIEFRRAYDSEYLKVILARIDTPRLDKLHITFDRPTYYSPELFQHISLRPTLSASDKDHITSKSWVMAVKFESMTSDYDVHNVAILYSVSEWQHSFFEQACTSCLLPFTTLEDLYIQDLEIEYHRLQWDSDVENTVLLDFLRSFVAATDPYISKDLMPHVATALQGLVGGRPTEVLPDLENIYWGDFSPQGPPGE